MIQGDSILEVFNNYYSLKISYMYDHLVVESNIVSTRRKTNTIMDIVKAKARKNQQ